ncbi:MAG: mandelate racemase [Chloroflexi bacterium]|nr:mandelate racemase [Chloroflexota bacterium]
MKITDLRVYLTKPEKNSRSWIFVEVDTDENITGVGECTNSGGGGAIVIAHAINVLKKTLEGQDFSDGLIGQDPNHIDRIWHQIYRRFTTLGSRGFATTLTSGIDMALWDIKGKMLNKPVYDLLGGAMREKIPLYSHISPADNIQKCVDDAKRQISLGYEALKLDPFSPEMQKSHRRYIDGKISHSAANHAEDLMNELRKSLGNDIELMIDAHGNFDVSTATNLCRRMEKFNLTWFEEPLQPESLESHRQLRKNTDINLCIGERKFTRWDFAPYLQEGLVNYIMPDICWTGGISELKRIAVLAETYYIPISPHDASGPINIIAGAHVMMNVPNIYRLEMNEHSIKQYNSVITDKLNIKNGFIHLPDKPGLGIELDHDFISSHPDLDWEKINS